MDDSESIVRFLLGNHRARGLMTLLESKRRSFSEIAKESDSYQMEVTRTLKRLRKLGLVRQKHEYDQTTGAFSFYEVTGFGRAIWELTKKVEDHLQEGMKGLNNETQTFRVSTAISYHLTGVTYAKA